MQGFIEGVGKPGISHPKNSPKQNCPYKIYTIFIGNTTSRTKLCNYNNNCYRYTKVAGCIKLQEYENSLFIYIGQYLARRCCHGYNTSRAWLWQTPSTWPAPSMTTPVISLMQWLIECGCEKQRLGYVCHAAHT